MTSSQDFLEGSEAKAVTEPTDQLDKVASVAESLYGELVGEGKKFSDAEALAKSKVEGDTHIVTVEEENAALRKKIESNSNNYDAILSKLEERENNNVSGKDKTDAVSISEPTEDVDLDQWFDDKLTQRDHKKIADANMQKSRELMIATYGNLETAVKVRDELLTTKPYMKEAINQLIISDPEQLIKEIQAFKSPEEVGNTSTDPIGNIPGGNPSSDGSRITWSEANKIRKSNLKQYNSPEFRQLMERSVAYDKQRGVDFYTT